MKKLGKELCLVLFALASVSFQLSTLKVMPANGKSTLSYLDHSNYSTLKTGGNLIGNRNIYGDNLRREKSIVRIEGPVSSSGVIIGRSGDTYFVLTTFHSINTQSEYTIHTQNGRRYTVTPRNYGARVRPIPEGIDLAIVEFQSDAIYQVATLSSGEIARSIPVHVIGWPEGTLQNPESSLFNVEGAVSQSRIISFEDGYQFAHTVPTRNGMSGGGVFNQYGHLIGIHGRRDGAIDPDSGIIISEPTSNWAIPIDNFLKLAFDDLKEHLNVIGGGQGGNTISTGTGGQEGNTIVTRGGGQEGNTIGTGTGGQEGNITVTRGGGQGGNTTGPEIFAPATLSGQVILSRASNLTNACIKFNEYSNGLPDGYQPFFTAWAPGGGPDIPMNYSSSAPCQGGYTLSRSLPSASLGGTLSIHDNIGLVDYVLVGNFSAELGSGCSDVGRVLSAVINWQAGGGRESASSSRIPIGGDYGWVCKP